MPLAGHYLQRLGTHIDQSICPPVKPAGNQAQASSMPLTPQQRWEFMVAGHTEEEVDDPLIEIRSNCLYCVTCPAWVTAEHIRCGRHQWRLDAFRRAMQVKGPGKGEQANKGDKGDGKAKGKWANNKGNGKADKGGNKGDDGCGAGDAKGKGKGAHHKGAEDNTRDDPDVAGDAGKGEGTIKGGKGNGQGADAGSAAAFFIGLTTGDGKGHTAEYERGYRQGMSACLVSLQQFLQMANEAVSQTAAGSGSAPTAAVAATEASSASSATANTGSAPTNAAADATAASQTAGPEQFTIASSSSSGEFDMVREVPAAEPDQSDQQFQ